MLYRFDKAWLKDKYRRYRDENNVRGDTQLKRIEKEILLGIHERHQQCASKPSDTDYWFLSDQYKKKSKLKMHHCI